jgi:ribosome-associated protein
LIDILEEKKGEKIVLLDLREIVNFTDYFIICNGTSDRMLQSLADAVIEGARAKLKIHGRIQGSPDGGWVVVDMGDVVIHLFSPDQRDFYKLEELWQAGKVVLRLQ